MNTWFTADHHFNHRGIIEHCNRPFTSVEEMNEKLIKNHNELVKPGDIVYHLGDFTLADVNVAKAFLNRLNGNIRLIPGGHDGWVKKLRDIHCEVLPLIYEYKFPKHNVPRIIVLSHCSMRVWEESHYNSWHLFGHSHGMLKPWGKSFDCGVDTHNLYPYSLDEVIYLMQYLPDNFNYIGDGK